MRLLIGAPVLRREWVIDRWLSYASASAERAGVDFGFMLLGRLGDPTFDVIDTLPAYDVRRVYIEEPETTERRGWAFRERLERMAEIRNNLLEHVRDDSPDVFLSCDTDVLLHPDAISNLIETAAARPWAAVGGYCHMVPPPSRSCPSYGNMPAPHVLRRPDIAGQVKRCDVVMAIVLITPEAYDVAYAYNNKGEDIGWSMNLRRRKLACGIDARVVNKHVREQRLLDVVDARCGY